MIFSVAYFPLFLIPYFQIHIEITSNAITTNANHNKICGSRKKKKTMKYNIKVHQLFLSIN